MNSRTMWSTAVAAVSLSLVVPMASAVEVGVGAGISGEDGGTIYVPIRFGNFRIEPEVSIYQDTDDTTYLTTPTSNRESEYTYVTIGSGVYWRQPIGSSLETYLGGRVGFARNESKTTYPNNPTNGYKSEESGFYIGPTLGAEYFFNKQFSIGLDVSLIYRSASGDYTPNTGVNAQSSDETSFYTEARTALRFYY